MERLFDDEGQGKMHECSCSSICLSSLRPKRKAPLPRLDAFHGVLWASRRCAIAGSFFRHPFRYDFFDRSRLITLIGLITAQMRPLPPGEMEVS